MTAAAGATMGTATATAINEHEAGLESPAFLNPDTVLLYYVALTQLATVADSGTFHDLPGLGGGRRGFHRLRRQQGTFAQAGRRLRFRRPTLQTGIFGSNPGNKTTNKPCSRCDNTSRHWPTPTD